MNKEVSKHVLNFADTKNNFPFAELALDHYLAFGGNDFEEILDLGAGIELLILAADIFDDIQDKDRPNAEWMKMDQAVSLNIATLIYTIALLSSTSYEAFKQYCGYQMKVSYASAAYKHLPV